MNTIFTQRVLETVCLIPKGKTLSYKEVAERAGNLGASRRVGAIMKTNFDTRVPCHRVIRSDGSLGEYNRGGPKKKQKLLQKEGAL